MEVKVALGSSSGSMSCDGMDETCLWQSIAHVLIGEDCTEVTPKTPMHTPTCIHTRILRTG